MYYLSYHESRTKENLSKLSFSERDLNFTFLSFHFPHVKFTAIIMNEKLFTFFFSIAFT